MADPATLPAADLVVVDNLEGCREDSRELRSYYEDRGGDWSEVVELKDVVGQNRRRPAGELIRTSVAGLWHTLRRLGVSVDARTPPRVRLIRVVSGNFFDVLGVKPLIGRTFVPRRRIVLLALSANASPPTRCR